MNLSHEHHELKQLINNMKIEVLEDKGYINWATGNTKLLHKVLRIINQYPIQSDWQLALILLQLTISCKVLLSWAFIFLWANAPFKYYYGFHRLSRQLIPHQEHMTLSLLPQGTDTINLRLKKITNLVCLTPEWTQDTPETDHQGANCNMVDGFPWSQNHTN